VSELLDIDPDNAEQLAHLATLEEEIEEEPPQTPEILMNLPHGINTNGNLVLDGTAVDLEEEPVVEEEDTPADSGLEALLRAISAGGPSLQDAGDDDADLDTDLELPGELEEEEAESEEV
jgi:hypothetical protein